MKFNKNAPRYSAGRIELKEGTGPIIEMCSTRNFLEIYKVDTTFKVQTPESLDPEETDPNMSGIATLSAKVGSGNNIVARIFIQSYKALKDKQFDNKINSENIIELLHESKELLLCCENTHINTNTQVLDQINKLEKNKIKREGNIFNPFPTVDGLDGYVTNFLINAKRFMQNYAMIFNEFYFTSCDGPHFHKILDWTEKNKKENEYFIEFLKREQEILKNIVEMRNAQEHPSNSRKLIADNFKLLVASH